MKKKKRDNKRGQWARYAADFAAGKTPREIAAKRRVSRATVYKALREARKAVVS